MLRRSVSVRAALRPLEALAYAGERLPMYGRGVSATVSYAAPTQYAPLMRLRVAVAGPARPALPPGSLRPRDVLFVPSLHDVRAT